LTTTMQKKGERDGRSPAASPDGNAMSATGLRAGTGHAPAPGSRAAGLAARGVAAAVLFLMLWVLACPLPAGAWGAKPQRSAAPVGELQENAPDFVLTDLKGDRFRLSEWRGKNPVLIIFSTTWCSFCKSEIPHFKKIYETYTQQGLVVVNIDIQESREKVAKFAAEHQLPYRVLLDGDGTVAGIYDIRGVPAMVLVDQQGKIVCRQCRDVETRIEKLLKK